MRGFFFFLPLLCVDMIYNFCFAGGGRDTPPHTPGQLKWALLSGSSILPCLQKSQSGSGLALDGGTGNKTPGRQLPELFLSESLDDPVFPNTALKMVYFLILTRLIWKWRVMYGLYAGQKKKKKKKSPAIYVSVFLTEGKIRQNFLQLLTNYFLLLGAVITC